ncbi:polar amino acid transport system substrate-binding protein [Leifsonia sp. EB41]|uniref:ABC transporter substrate-binding protein n=1 Tax=Leifsonia sp. EB41 TaxID=3156260 RepID=UPI0035156E4E
MKSNVKVAIAVPLISLAALAFTGCSAADGAKPSPSESKSVTVPSAKLDKEAQALLPADVRAAGALTAVTNAGYPPYEMFASDNKTIIGRDIDFAKALSETLGVDIKFDNVSFDAIIPGINSGRYQLAISGLTVTPERLQAADFVTYSESGSNLAVAPGNPQHLKASDAKTLCGKTIGVTKGSSDALVNLPNLNKQCLAAGKKAIDAKEFPDEGSRLALSSGRVDAILDDALSLAYSAQKSNGQYELAAGPDIAPAASGIALVKDSPLTPAIAAAVKNMVTQQKAVYEAINEKWGVPADHILTADQVDNK